MNANKQTPSESRLPKKSRFRAVMFDKDGTLFDFRKTWLPILRKAAAHFAGDNKALAEDLVKAGGYDPDSDRFDPSGPIAAGNSQDMANAWHGVLSRHGWKKPASRSAANASSPLHREQPVIPERSQIVEELDRASREAGVAGSVPVTDLYALFSKLYRSGIILGLATSDSEESACASLEREGIEGFFTVVIGYNSPGAKKPSPDVVHNFCRRTGVAEADVLVVGDTWHDIDMARAAGAGSVAVLTGAIERTELEPYADVVLASIADLPLYLGIE